MQRRLVWLSCSLAVLTLGCRRQQEPPPARATDPACVGPVATGTPVTVVLNGVTWEVSGSTAAMKSALTGPLAVGVLSDIKEDSPENRANVRELASWFVKRGASFVLVAGDSGMTAEEIEGSLSVLAESGLPVFVIIGNREGRHAFKTALGRLRSRRANVFDLTVVRRIDTPALDVVSMPGYFDPAFVHPGEAGCTYQPADVHALAELVKACDSPRLLVSHGPPRQRGPLALDRVSDGRNVGDPELARAITELAIPFGVFGNIHESGGRATDASGERLVPQGELVPSLYLNPGPADAVLWMMNDGTRSAGMGALLTVAGGKAKYEVLRLGEQDGAVAGRGEH